MEEQQKQNLKALLESLKEAVAKAEGDLEKFVEKENKSAGTRVRGAMQDVKTLAQNLRVEVQKAKA